jgi:hypothetical protein
LPRRDGSVPVGAGVVRTLTPPKDNLEKRNCHNRRSALMEQRFPGPLKLHPLPRPLVNEMLVVNPMTRTIVDMFPES